MTLQTIHLSNKKQLHCIDTKGLHSIFHKTTIIAIQKTLEKGKKVIIYIQKKGLHSGISCDDCGHIPYCKNCDIPIAMHQNAHNQLFGLCSICQELYSSFTACPECGSSQIHGYGVGIQQVDRYCAWTFKQQPVLVQSSTSNSSKKSLQLLEDIKDNQIIIATGLLQAPLIDNVGLIIVQNAGPNGSPDYSAHRDAFLFLKQVCAYNSDHIILQTRSIQHLILQSILKQEDDLFLNHDDMFRIRHNYPPHGELCLLIYRHEVESALYSKINKIFQEMMQIKMHEWYSEIEIYAIPAQVYKAYNKFRFQIIVKWPLIREYMDTVFLKCKPLLKSFKMDWWARGFM